MKCRVFRTFWTGSVFAVPLKFNFNSTRSKNSSLFQEDIGQDISVLLVRRRYDVGIDIRGCAHFGMSKPFRDRNTVDVIEIQKRSHCMTERVRVDMGKAVAFGELAKPRGHAIRVHGLPVVLGEDETLIIIVFAQA